MLLKSKEILLFYYASLLRDSCSEIFSFSPNTIFYRQIKYPSEVYPTGVKKQIEDSRKSITKNALKITLQEMLEDITSAINPGMVFHQINL